MMSFFFCKKLNNSLTPLPHSVIFQKYFLKSVGRNKLFFQGQKKAATYGRLRQLMTYLLWFLKIESISVDFLVKNRFHAFLWHKMERKSNRRLKLSEEETPRKKQKQEKRMSFFVCKKLNNSLTPLPKFVIFQKYFLKS